MVPVQISNSVETFCHRFSLTGIRIELLVVQLCRFILHSSSFNHTVTKGLSSVIAVSNAIATVINRISALAAGVKVSTVTSVLLVPTNDEAPLELSACPA